MSSTFIIDNRVLATGSFISEVSRSAIQTCTLKLLGSYIVMCEKHSWLPRASICYAASADSIQETKAAADVSIISSLATILEPKHACYGVDVNRTSWNYMCCGLEHYLNSLTPLKSRNIKQRGADEKPMNFMVCLITSDKALLLSAQGHNISTGDTTYKERMRFRKLCSLISITIAEIYGPRAYVDIRIACAMVTRLPAGDVNVISFQTHTQTQPDIDFEITKIRSELATLDCTQYSNLDVVYAAFIPSPLLFQEQLRHIVDVHAPALTATLKLPPFEDKLCLLNIQLSANTLQGADAIHQYFKHDMPSVGASTATSVPPTSTATARLELGEIYSFAPRSKMPACYLAGPALSMTAAELSLGGKEGPWHQNCLAFAALAATMIQLDAVLVLRVCQSSGEASYWYVPHERTFEERSSHVAHTYPPHQHHHYIHPHITKHHNEHTIQRATVPPAHDVNIAVNMTLLKLADQESMLIAGDTQFVTASGDRVGATGDDIKDERLVDRDSCSSDAAGDQGNYQHKSFHMGCIDSKDQKAFFDTVAYLRGALLSTFGSPAPFNPLCCPTEGLELALNRYCSAPPALSQVAPPPAPATSISTANANASGGKRQRSPRSATQGLRVGGSSGAGRKEVEFVEQVCRCV